MVQQLIDDIIGRRVAPSACEASASRLIDTCGYAAAAATLFPIPGTEIIAVMPIHVGMVVGLSQLYDAEITRDSAADLVLRIGATVGTSLVTSRAAITLAKVALPGIGGLIGAPLIFATTIAIGAVARAFFDQDGDVSSEEMRTIYKEAVKRARRSYDPKRAQSEAARDQAQGASAEGAAGTEKAEDPQPPAPAKESQDPVSRLHMLKAMRDADLIEPEEYETTKRRILRTL
ncbi:MAG: DUF697 domain-containing protein [Myxococcota bacterium]|nr:DUF697 domain-containing protein [Myxococcota bacterium]